MSSSNSEIRKLDHSNEDEEKIPLSRATASGFGWSGMALIGKQAFQFITLAILARLLEPSDFGTIALVLIVTDFIALFNGELGFSEALVQRDDITPIHYSSVFWMNLVVGTIMGVGIYFCSSMIGNFYQEQTITQILKVIAIYFPIYSFRTVPLAILYREMKFRSIAIAEIAAVLVSGIVGVTLALQGAGVWSLVWRYIVSMMVMIVVLWQFARWKPTTSFRFSTLSDLFGFSANTLGFYFWEYWTLRADNFLIGKYLGTESLGFYTRGYTTAMLPYQLAAVIRRVMLPTLSRSKDDKQISKELYLQVLSTATMIVAPIMLGLCVVAKDFVLVVYGENWLPIVDSMRWLCITSILLTLGSTVDSIYKAQGRTDILFRWGIISGLGAILSFIIGINIGGIEAVAICYTFTLTLLFYWQFTLPGRLINMKIIDICRSIYLYILCSLIMAVSLLLFDTFFFTSLPPFPNLITLTFIGALIYITSLEVLRTKPYVQLRNHLFRILYDAKYSRQF